MGSSLAPFLRLWEGLIPWPSFTLPLSTPSKFLRGPAAHLGSQGFRKSSIMSAVLGRQAESTVPTEPVPAKQRRRERRGVLGASGCAEAKESEGQVRGRKGGYEQRARCRLTGRVQ